MSYAKFIKNFDRFCLRNLRVPRASAHVRFDNIEEGRDLCGTWTEFDVSILDAVGEVCWNAWVMRPRSRRDRACNAAMNWIRRKLGWKEILS